MKTYLFLQTNGYGPRRQDRSVALSGESVIICAAAGRRMFLS